MMTQCPEYKGKDLLKMYPTWTKSEAKELTRLGEKYGKTLPNRFKRPSKQEPVYPTKRATPTKQHREATSMPPRRPKPPKEKEVYDLSSNEDFSSTPNQGAGNLPFLLNPSISRQKLVGPVEKTLEKPATDKVKGPTRQNKCEANLFLFSTGTTLPLMHVQHLRREDIEKKVKAMAKTFTVESSCELAPLPLEVMMNGLYVLLSETNVVMSRKVLDDSEETTALLMKMEIEEH